MAVFIQTDLKTVPLSIPEGREERGRMEKLGTVDWNQGVGERSSLNHCPVGFLASSVRVYTRASRGSC